MVRTYSCPRRSTNRIRSCMGAFREPDLVNTTTQILDNLRIGDHQHITKYSVDFNESHRRSRLCTICEHYKGLTPQIKHGSSYSRWPDTLAVLRTRPVNFELRYWERKNEEATRTNVPNILSSRYSPSSTSSSRSLIPVASTTSTPKSKKPDLSIVLGPDGKLLSNERSDGIRMGYALRL